MLDVMVEWEQATEHASSIARVSSFASTGTLEAPSRDVVTLYGQPTPESFALALAAAVESRKASQNAYSLRSLNISESADAVGDSAYHDRRTGELIRQDLVIPLTVLRETAADLLNEFGQGIRRLLAGLLMPEWPEGTKRALTFELAIAGPRRTSDTLAVMREADGGNFADE